MNKIVLYFILCLAASSCHSSRIQVSRPMEPGLAIHGKIFTTAYQQTAAEYRALCYQAFNLARYRVDMYKPGNGLKPAIITDVDETVLDNSPYAVNRARIGLDYEPFSWFEWTDRSSAKEVPGAGDFLRYASSRGIEIFYITNRDKRERNSTVENLRKLGMPNADTIHVLTKESGSAKEPRRKEVLKSHELVLFLGDNLSDFSFVFDKKTVSERNNLVDLNEAEFGRNFILIPNPVYGDWEGSIYQYNYKLSPAQKDSAIRSTLTGY